MKDVNIMTVPRYVPKAPGAPANTGYDSDNRQAIEPSFVDVQTTVDYDSQNFKYGLGYWEGNIDNKKRYPLQLFQDPLFPTIDVIIDTTNSPLFRNDNKGCTQFLQDYGDIYSIRARQKILEEFKRICYLLFNKDADKVDRTKAYYINSISGLDKITARIVDFEKDKITINLNEDVSMMTAYLAHLYNNLSYSYKDQRQMVPANLLRFNMYLKVNDVRNMPWYVPDAGTGYTTMFDKSYQIYLLRDCTFIFRNSKNFDDSVTIGGFDAGAPTKPSSINFDVVYKSIEIESEYPLIMNNLDDFESSALKLNNKDKDVVGYIDGLNTVYDKYSKLPEDFYGELESNGEINNQRDGGIQTGSTTTVVNYGKTSSQRGTNDNRDSYLKGSDVPKKNTTGTSDNAETIDPESQVNYRNDIVSDIDAKNTWGPNNEEIDPESQVNYRADRVGVIDSKNTWGTYDKAEPFDPDAQFSYRSSVVDSIPYPYIASVYQSDWDNTSNTSLQHPQTGPALQVWRDSLLGQLNLGGFLWSLPFNIIQFFFGGYHGMAPDTYIDNYAPNIPSMDEIYIDTVKPPVEGLDGEKIEIILNQQIPLTATIDTTYTLHQPLAGSIDTTFIIHPSVSGVIDTSFKPHPALSGTINTSFKPLIPISGFIDTSYKPQLPISGVIDTSFKPHPSVSGTINTSFKPLIPISGVIDTSFIPHPPVSGVIDTSFKPHPPVSGVIDTSFIPHPPVSGVIDTTIKTRVFNLGYAYTNTSVERIIDLGLLYLPITKENIIPLIYLYTKTDKFNSLFDYYVYNNSISESKSLNQLEIEQTVREITSFNIIYEYDNNIDLEKTLNNATLYNNRVEKENNMVVLNVIGSIPDKEELPLIKLYTNTDSNKSLTKTYLYDEKESNNQLTEVRLYVHDDLINKKLDGEHITFENIISVITNLGSILKDVPVKEDFNVGYLYETSSVKKLLEPLKLFEPPMEEKKIELGNIYENINIEAKNILQPDDRNISENIRTFDKNMIKNEVEEKYKDLSAGRLNVKEYIYKLENIQRKNDITEINVNSAQFIKESQKDRLVVREELNKDKDYISQQPNKDHTMTEINVIADSLEKANIQKNYSKDTHNINNEFIDTSINKIENEIRSMEMRELNVNNNLDNLHRKDMNDLDNLNVNSEVSNQDDKEMVKMNVNENELKSKDSIDGLHIDIDKPKEKEGLNNERLR